MLLYHLLRNANELRSLCTIHQLLGRRDLPRTAAEQKTGYLETCLVSLGKEAAEGRHLSPYLLRFSSNTTGNALSPAPRCLPDHAALAQTRNPALASLGAPAVPGDPPLSLRAPAGPGDPRLSLRTPAVPADPPLSRSRQLMGRDVGRTGSCRAPSCSAALPGKTRRSSQRGAPPRAAALHRSAPAEPPGDKPAQETHSTGSKR